MTDNPSPTPSWRKEARERAEKATPGRWERYDERGLIVARCKGRSDVMIGYIGAHSTVEERQADRDFICHARTDLPRVLDELDQAESALAAQSERMRQVEGERDDWIARCDLLAAEIAALRNEAESDESSSRRKDEEIAELKARNNTHVTAYDELARDLIEVETILADLDAAIAWGAGEEFDIELTDEQVEEPWNKAIARHKARAALTPKSTEGR